jgi:splicing factor 3B subunit 1
MLVVTPPPPQQNAVDLVGRIADRGAEFVSAREWMRICTDLPLT